MIKSCLLLLGLYHIRPKCWLCMLLVHIQWEDSRNHLFLFTQVWTVGASLAKMVAAFFCWSDGVMDGDRYFRVCMIIWWTCFISMAKCHHHSLPQNEPQKFSPLVFFYFLSSCQSFQVTVCRTSYQSDSETKWQRGKLLKKKSLSLVSVSLTPLSQSFSSLWLGGRRFPNKLAETCCLWVRPSSPPAGHQSCHPQCKQVALASQGERAERVGVTQATPIQNSQLTSKPRLWLRSPISCKTLVFMCVCVSLSGYCALILHAEFTYSIK